MITIADYVPELTTYLWRRQNRADPVTTKAPISLRVEIPGYPRAEISTGVKATPEEWDQDYQELRPSKRMSKTERAYQKEQMDRITDLRRKVERMYHAYKGQGANPSPKQLRELIRGYKPKQPTRETSFAGVLEMYRKDVVNPARGLSTSTIENNVKYTLWLLMYMHHTGQLPTLAADVNRTWMRSFERWAESRGLKASTLRQVIGTARLALEMAEAEGIIAENKLVGYKYLTKRSKPKKLRLAEEAVLGIEQYAFPKRLQRLADMFLFMCYTGLSHIDYLRFAKEPERFLCHKEHPVTQQPVLGIDMARQKMEAEQEESWMPLLKKARAMLVERYAYQLPHFTRSYANRRLKVIAEMAGINASFISNKVARATFSQMMRDEYGGEISAAMARHDLNTANKHYSSVSPKRIMSVLGMDLADN